MEGVRSPVLETSVGTEEKKRVRGLGSVNIMKPQIEVFLRS